MFYRPGLDGHDLAHDPFKALVAPRPIGWISSLDGEGRANLAPYSFFNAISEIPPMVAYASNGRSHGPAGKDTLANIRATGEFVANIVPFALVEAMVATSASLPPGADEFAAGGLTAVPGRIVAAPRVAEAPAALECRLWRIIELPGGGNNNLVIGEVVGVHIDPGVLVDGKVDVTRYAPVARLGYRDYAAVQQVFAMTRPSSSPGG